MKRLFLVLLLVALAATLAVAQSQLTEVAATANGLTVSHPDTYSAQESDDPNVLSLLNLRTFTVITLGQGAGIDTVLGTSPDMPLDAQMDTLEFAVGMLGFKMQPALSTEETLANGTAQFIVAVGDEGGGIVFAILDLTTGEQVAMSAVSFGGDLTAELTDIRAILATVTIDEAGAQAATSADTDTPQEVPVTPPDGETITFDSGLSIAVPAGYTLPVPVNGDAVTLQTSDTLVTLTIIVEENSDLYVDALRQSVASIFTGLGASSTLDIDDLRTEVTTPGGVTVEIYDSRLEEDREDPGFDLLLFLAPVTDDHFLFIQATILTMLGDVAFDQVQTDTLALIESARVSDASASASTAEATPFVSTDETVSLASLDLAVSDAQCSLAARDLVSEDVPVAAVQCPANCTTNSVWGTDVYTDDSSICTAAIHAGATQAKGGLVVITWQPGQDAYPASTRNGISTAEWGSWGGSFTVAPATR